MSDEQVEQELVWTQTSAMTAPALLGAAAGLIIGEVMHTNARRGVAIGLASLGVAALMPMAVVEVINRINGPRTRRGVQRRLRGIRDAGDGYVEDYIDHAS